MEGEEEDLQSPCDGEVNIYTVDATYSKDGEMDRLVVTHQRLQN